MKWIPVFLTILTYVMTIIYLCLCEYKIAIGWLYGFLGWLCVTITEKELRLTKTLYDLKRREYVRNIKTVETN